MKVVPVMAPGWAKVEESLVALMDTLGEARVSYHGMD
jgi:hypothetical protein